MKLLTIIVVFLAFSIIDVFGRDHVESSNVPEQSNCKNRHGINGICISIEDCKLLKKFQTDYSSFRSARKFIEDSKCQREKQNHVCCIMKKENYTTPRTTETRKDDKSPPSLSSCGRSGTKKDIDQFFIPLNLFSWMIILRYSKTYGNPPECGGVLISNRYVLAAAHCIERKYLGQNRNLIGVNLREYNSKKFRYISIEQKKVHESYNSSSRIHDIGLLKLSETVNLNDEFTPICLSSSDVVSNDLTVAGWNKGKSNDNYFKIADQAKIINYTECMRKFRNSEFEFQTSQICASGMNNGSFNQILEGVMMEYTYNSHNGYLKWSVIGLTSTRDFLKTNESTTIYTKVAYYVKWIEENMKP